MFDRSMTIHLANRTDMPLLFGDAGASSGPVPTAVPTMVQPGQSMTVSAHNPSGGCDGHFRVAGAGMGFDITYRHPLGAGATTVAMTAAPGYLAIADATTFPGHDAVAAVGLYRGITSGSGWVAPLELLDNPPRDNAQDFVNSVYGPGVRDGAIIHAAYGHPSPDGYVQPADFTGGQLAGLAGLLSTQWLSGTGACPAVDAALLRWLAGYVRTASPAGALTMWVPQMRHVDATSPSVFSLSGYRRFDFVDGQDWDAATVSAFCNLLVAGAHFVAVCADRDLPSGVPVLPLDRSMDASGLPTRHDPGNSHYATLLNVTGTYVQPADGDFAGRGSGLLQAMLVGRTVNDMLASPGSYNNFLQLEGWPAISSRHNADYIAHQRTAWNISTFGASPYSEKRATTVFLAPPGWEPTLYQTTLMMPYVGAYAVAEGVPQSWLDTSLAKVPSTAPPLPARFIG